MRGGIMDNSYLDNLEFYPYREYVKFWITAICIMNIMYLLFVFSPFVPSIGKAIFVIVILFLSYLAFHIVRMKRVRVYINKDSVRILNVKNAENVIMPWSAFTNAYILFSSKGAKYLLLTPKPCTRAEQKKILRCFLRLKAGVNGIIKPALFGS